jgi:UPF0755 protein
VALDGPIGAAENPDTGPEMMTFPVPAERRAGQKARSARNSLPVGADDLPPEDEIPGDARSDSAQISGSSTDAAVKAPRIYDASEGTNFDPLRNRTYDLNYTKTVPGQAKK